MSAAALSTVWIRHLQSAGSSCIGHGLHGWLGQGAAAVDPQQDVLSANGDTAWLGWDAWVSTPRTDVRIDAADASFPDRDRRID
jgi:hypothetical protein